MSNEKEKQLKFILNLKRKGIKDSLVLRTMEEIDRKLFLDGIFKSKYHSVYATLSSF